MQIPDGIEMVHPVYTHEEFVERAYRKFGLGLGRWDWVARALESADALIISDELKEQVRQRIPENMRSWPFRFSCAGRRLRELGSDDR